MSKKIAIVQSCYIPWKGYFDLINQVDEFIFYDDVQFTRRDWRNRNIIKTAKGLLYLTIPVEVKSRYLQKINETKIADARWGEKHWKSIFFNYSKAPYFRQYCAFFETLYIQCKMERYLSQVNFKFIQHICKLLNIRTRLSWSTSYAIDANLKKTERLLELCQQANATHYVSGPAAKNYMQTDLFEKIGIKVSYMDYSDYPPYLQLFDGFEHAVTILDLIFNTGSNASSFLKSFSSENVCQQ